MVRYSIKPTKETTLKGFTFDEIRIASDLTSISGVTDYNNGLVNGEIVLLKSPFIIGDAIYNINVTNVKRQGKVKVDVTIPVKTLTETLKYTVLHNYEENKSYIVENNEQCVVDDYEDYIIKESTQKYVEFNNDISYFYNGETLKGYLIDHKFYEAQSSDTEVKISTYLDIEDGVLTLGENTYYADFSKVNEKPELRLSKYVEPIKAGDELGVINDCSYSAATSDEDDSIPMKYYKPSDWKRVSKFVIVKNGDVDITPEDMLFGGYRHFVIYQDEKYYAANTYDKEGNYSGYGVTFNEEFHVVPVGNSNEEIFNEHKDIMLTQSIIYMEDTEEVLEVENALIAPKDGGKFLFFINERMNDDIEEGNIITAKSNGLITVTRNTTTDSNGKMYVEFNGKRYDVKERLYDTITLSDYECKLNYLDDERTSAITEVNGETINLEIEEDGDFFKAKIVDKIYYKTQDSTDEKILVEYGKDKETKYDVITRSGITIDDKIYPIKFTADRNVFDTIDELSETITSLTENDVEESGDASRIVTFLADMEYELEVYEVQGASTYLCYPVVDDNIFTEYEADAIMREITANIVNNWQYFTFKVKKSIFGVDDLTPKNGMMASMSATTPYTISQMYKLENTLQILRIQDFLSLKLPMVNNTADNLFREDIIRNQFVNDVKEASVNTIVDMEKDVYYPVWKDEDEFKPICQLRFNLHFRTRNMDNWKVINDDREYKNNITPNSERCSWFVTDFSYYKNDISADTKKKLHNSSDLLGLLNFTTSEVKNRASKLAKSFLRLSFYSTNNPNTQVLLSTATVYFNENEALSKYMALKRNSDLKYIDLLTMETAGYTSFTEYQTDVENNEALYQVSSKTVSDSSEVVDDEYLSDTLRLSSRFTIDDKYRAQSSSEGFYFYMFKDYAKKMREATVYLKVDFNHAGVGTTIPFMLPRKEDGTPFYLDKDDDVEELKDGFKMKDIYNQIFIPIRIKYDDRENRYVYYLPNELRENDYLEVEDEIMEFNLFEAKFANESIVDADENNQ